MASDVPNILRPFPPEATYLLQRLRELRSTKARPSGRHEGFLEASFHRALRSRDSDIENVREHLRQARFVTIVGSVGIGKTTIATAVINKIAHTFDGGTFFFDLSTITDPSMLLSAISSAIGSLVPPTIL
jgi:ABC-type glutathione transport system ATPase component